MIGHAPPRRADTIYISNKIEINKIASAELLTQFLLASVANIWLPCPRDRQSCIAGFLLLLDFRDQ
jgi:hypothetical protein